MASGGFEIKRAEIRGLSISSSNALPQPTPHPPKPPRDIPRGQGGPKGDWVGRGGSHASTLWSEVRMPCTSQSGFGVGCGCPGGHTGQSRWNGGCGHTPQVPWAGGNPQSGHRQRMEGNVAAGASLPSHASGIFAAVLLLLIRGRWLWVPPSKERRVG